LDHGQEAFGEATTFVAVVAEADFAPDHGTSQRPFAGRRVLSHVDGFA